MIYFIRAGQSDMIKIGHAKHVQSRLILLQSGHPDVLSVLRTLDLPNHAEGILHKEFQEFHVRGEWFRFCERMLTFIPAVPHREAVERRYKKPPLPRPEHKEGDIPTPDLIRWEAEQAGLNIVNLCRRAGVATSTFHRWGSTKQGPTLDTVQRWLDVIHAAKFPHTKDPTCPISCA